MKNNNIYESPVLEIVSIKDNDIITTSAGFELPSDEFAW